MNDILGKILQLNLQQDLLKNKILNLQEQSSKIEHKKSKISYELSRRGYSEEQIQSIFSNPTVYFK